jgi:hypothetical protein
MSVIFQLFSAEDLRDLTPVQLESIKNAIRDALQNPPRVPDQVKGRIYEVFRQLTSKLPSNPPVSPDPSSPILYQLLSEEDLRLLDHKQLDILKMAISCEMANSFYALWAIKDSVHAVFHQFRGQPPQGPDASYAPFSRNYSPPPTM